jgi:hypothetical protein
MPSFFISYRRDESSAEAILVRDAIRRELGNESVFMDTWSLQGGGVVRRDKGCID